MSELKPDAPTPSAELLRECLTAIEELKKYTLTIVQLGVATETYVNELPPLSPNGGNHE